ncbi:alpha/beta fold hydrolase [Microbacterium sp. zg-Y1211]|nr:alpha/beta fold hydrolase [Microbacterium sp. zg-Y1211]
MTPGVPPTRTGRHVRHGTLRFRVVESSGPSRSNRPVVVLVHGIGMSHRSLRRLHDALAAHEATVFSIDLPGYGGLPKPDHDVDVAGMAEGLAGVLATLDTGPVVLVGHSMGAQWVVETACRRPDLVAQVVAIGPVADERHRSLPAQAGALALDTLRESPVANAIVFTDYLRCGIRYYLAQVRHMIDYPIEQRVADLAVPLQVIRGQRDPVARADWCRRLADAASDATVVEIPAAAHIVQHTAPRAVASAILARAGLTAAT